MTISAPQSLSDIRSESDENFTANLSQRYTVDRIFQALTWFAVLLSLLVLLVLLYDICHDGAAKISWHFLDSFPSRKPADAGIKAAINGSIWLLFLTALFSFPMGVGAGIYLEEFSPDNIFTQLIEINIGNLAAVPSIIYGLLGLQVFVRIMEPITKGRSVLAGALTLALLILPIIIVATREALRAVPNSLRQGGFALGATRWQVVRALVLPQALPGILTGTILALSRAIGETAPLLAIGALAYVPFLVEGPQSAFSALPVQIHNWVSRPQAAFHENAAGAIIVLMILLLTMNSVAIIMRNRFQQTRS